MSKSPRREQIEQLLRSDPNDTFLVYSLAMEMASAGESEDAVKQLSPLMELDPPYVPAFFMSAQNLTQLDRIAEARVTLERGIEQAERQGNDHAAGEMREFLDGLPGEV